GSEGFAVRTGSDETIGVQSGDPFPRPGCPLIVAQIDAEDRPGRINRQGLADAGVPGEAIEQLSKTLADAIELCFGPAHVGEMREGEVTGEPALAGRK